MNWEHFACMTKWLHLMTSTVQCKLNICAMVNMLQHHNTLIQACISQVDWKENFGMTWSWKTISDRNAIVPPLSRTRVFLNNILPKITHQTKFSESVVNQWYYSYFFFSSIMFTKLLCRILGLYKTVPL